MKQGQECLAIKQILPYTAHTYKIGTILVGLGGYLSYHKNAWFLLILFYGLIGSILWYYRTNSTARHPLPRLMSSLASDIIIQEAHMVVKQGAAPMLI